MLRSLLFRSTAPIDLTQDEEVLFPDTPKHVTPSTHTQINNADNNTHCLFVHLTFIF